MRLAFKSNRIDTGNYVRKYIFSKIFKDINKNAKEKIRLSTQRRIKKKICFLKHAYDPLTLSLSRSLSVYIDCVHIWARLDRKSVIFLLLVAQLLLFISPQGRQGEL
jgi:hypothetical protein